MPERGRQGQGIEGAEPPHGRPRRFPQRPGDASGRAGRRGDTAAERRPRGLSPERGGLQRSRARPSLPEGLQERDEALHGSDRSRPEPAGGGQQPGRRGDGSGKPGGGRKGLRVHSGPPEVRGAAQRPVQSRSHPGEAASLGGCGEGADVGSRGRSELSEGGSGEGPRPDEERGVPGRARGLPSRPAGGSERPGGKLQRGPLSPDDRPAGPGHAVHGADRPLGARERRGEEGAALPRRGAEPDGRDR